jgi:hypothetical protein
MRGHRRLKAQYMAQADSQKSTTEDLPGQRPGAQDGGEDDVRPGRVGAVLA